MSTARSPWAVLTLALLLGAACSQEVERRESPLTALQALIEGATPLPFERVGDEDDEAAIDFPESSGLTYHPLRKTLFTVSDDGDTMFLHRVAFDPRNFSQNFTRVPGGFGPGGDCVQGRPCCIFKDDVDALVDGVKGTRVRVRVGSGSG